MRPPLTVSGYKTSELGCEMAGKRPYVVKLLVIVVSEYLSQTCRIVITNVLKFNTRGTNSNPADSCCEKARTKKLSCCHPS